MKRFVCVLLLCAATIFAADVVPLNRRMDWSVAGVPGGIPTNRTLYVNVRDAVACAALGLDPAFGDGVIDDAAALTGAWKHCPPGKYVLIPAGTYRCVGTVGWQSSFSGSYPGPANCSIVGENSPTSLSGPKTILKFESGGYLTLGSQESPVPGRTFPGTSLAITGGATLNSTVLTVADASTVNVGNFVTITATAAWYHQNASGAGHVGEDGYLYQLEHLVTDKTSTTVTITPPLPDDLSGLSPLLFPWGNAGLNGPTWGVGIENLSIDCSSIGSTAPIHMEQVYGCWVKNVEYYGGSGKQMVFLTAVRCEVRHCYSHDISGGGPNHEGIDLLNNCCYNLVEDNIVGGGFPPVCIGDSAIGGVGNVVAYNYIGLANSGSSVAGFSLCDNHGWGDTLNLIEGNWTEGGMQSDGYKGGAVKTTIARNVIGNKYLPQDGVNNLGPMAIGLHRCAVYYNVVGNILGSTGITQPGGGAVIYEATENGPYRVCIYKLGYPGSGNFSWSGTIGPSTPPDYSSLANNYADSTFDLNVEATLIRKGNYNTVDDAIPAGEALAGATVANSYRYSAKPSWWPPSLSWPPYDSASPTLNEPERLPAGYRYTNGVDPAGSGTIGTTSVSGSGHTAQSGAGTTTIAQ